jgi:hypothetical protein
MFIVMIVLEYLAVTTSHLVLRFQIAIVPILSMVLVHSFSHAQIDRYLFPLVYVFTELISK